MVAALLAAMAQIGLAQETTGAITGKITDPSGGAIVGGPVQLAAQADVGPSA